jgi:hypothetical protein
MRTNVTFRHPAEFVPLSEDDGILAVSGAKWFGALLGRVPGLVIDDNACQEDWGVVFFVRHNQKKFWIGLSAWDEKGTWLSHFHDGSFAWLSWFGFSGQTELMKLVSHVHIVLATELLISDIAWHEESEMSKPEPASFSTPVDD